MKHALIFCIVAYQKFFRFHRIAPCCKYYPSCSEYAKIAIRKYGAITGSIKSIWRIFRCNPLSGGGLDLP